VRQGIFMAISLDIGSRCSSVIALAAVPAQLLFQVNARQVTGT